MPVAESEVPVLPAPDAIPCREPFWYWLFGPQDRWLKTCFLLAVALAGLGAVFCAREYGNRSERNAAWSDMQAARDIQDFPRMLDSAERFLSHPVIGADARTVEIRELYDEALVRWFNEARPSAGLRGARIERYRRLSGVEAIGDRP
jgi:hypothetical protein